MNQTFPQTANDFELRPYWNRLIKFDWKFGLALILIVCIPRFLLVLNANASGNYSAIGILMLISAIVPFVFLGRYGQKVIGIKKPKNFRWLLWAFATGLIASLLLYYVGQALYGNTYQNWYAYIGKSYQIPFGINSNDKRIMFVAMALVGMTFSPVGEELFFRGIVHSSFAKSIGEKRASVVDGLAFALTHVSHYGLVFIDGKWDFFVLSTIIWVSGMFLLSLLFFWFRKKSNSILGAILCHAAFNLGMIYCIFYLL
ncbi:lysostaphin resistance A-like protein [Aquiflexum sp.]|uniref:CPBP family intramembrane glutamic endopeptidase n=1 Tax=Aquiflexum sp. TaxID=1872584 RepID=UPI0035930142